MLFCIIPSHCSTDESKDDETTLWLVTMKQNVYAHVCIVAMHMYVYND